MKRKLEKKGPTTLPSPPEAIGWGLAAAFVGVSLLMAVVCAWKMGAPSGMAIPFAAIAAAVVGFKALGLALTFGRGHWVAGLVALPLVLVCYAFTVTAGHQFARDNLYTAANATQAEATAYEASRERVEVVRAQLKGITEARSVDVIRAAIDGHRQHARWLSTKSCTDATVPPSFDYCQAYSRLQADLAIAEKRDRLSAELPAALAALTEQRSSAGAAHDAGPVAAVVGQLTGYEFASFEEFFAWLVVLAVELGDIIVPFVMAMAAKPVRKQVAAADPKAKVAQIIEDAQAEEEARRALRTDAERARAAKLAQLRRFMDGCTERVQEGEIKSTSFHSVYTTWAIGEGLEPMKLQMFGTLLTQELRVPKVKKGSTLYLGLRIKKDWHAKPTLRAVNGGKN